MNALHGLQKVKPIMSTTIFPGLADITAASASLVFTSFTAPEAICVASSGAASTTGDTCVPGVSLAPCKCCVCVCGGCAYT